MWVWMCIFEWRATHSQSNQIYKLFYPNERTSNGTTSFAGAYTEQKMEWNQTKPNSTKRMRKKNKIKEITLWTRKNELLVCILCALNRAVSFSIESWIKYTESTNTQTNYTYAYTIMHLNSYPTRTRKEHEKKHTQNARSHRGKNE